VAPGTVGSLLGVALYFLLRNLSAWVYGSVLSAIFVLGLYCAGRVEKTSQAIDPPHIVIDEVLGMLLTYFFLPPGSLGVLLGFALFRLFDILKPPPARWLERRPGGWGVMLDDIAAAGYAHLATRWIVWWVG
jgi:phosphatidylglycerophosphatase A